MRCGCWLSHAGATVFGTTVDVGAGGLFLRTALPLAKGAVVEVVLELPSASGQEVVSARGMIARRVSVGEGRPGLGVEFAEIVSGAALLSSFLGGDETELTSPA